MRIRSTRLLALSAVLTAPVAPTHAQSWVTDLTPNDGMPYDRFGFALAADQGRLLVSSFAAETAPQLQDVGAAYVFEQGPTGWVQSARLDPSNPVSHAQFGRSVALVGNFAVVGAPGAAEYGSESGVAYVFERLGAWVETQRLVPSPGGDYDLFGSSVAVDGARLVVGAPRNDGFAQDDGAAFVYERQGTQWIQTAVLYGEPSPLPQSYGLAVAVHGDTIAVAAPTAYGNEKETGRVYVYENDGGAWQLTSRLEDPAAEPYQRFGYSLDLRGDRLAVGLPYSDLGAVDSGAVRVFERGPVGWEQRWSFAPPEVRANQRYGFRLGMTDTLLFAASPFGGEGASMPGQVWVYGQAGASWLELPAPVPPKPAPGDGFGSSLAFGASYIAFGVWGDSEINPANPGQGSASVFSLDGVPQHTAYCFGEGCPCGNIDGDGGCQNSTGRGARLSASGTLSEGRGDLHVWADRLTSERMTVLVAGQAPAWSLAGDGLRCVASGAVLVGGVRSSGASGALDYEFPELAATGALVPGASLYLQALYRDEAGPCNQRFNLTNALALTVVP